MVGDSRKPKPVGQNHTLRQTPDLGRESPTRGDYPEMLHHLTSNSSQSPETVSYSLNVVRTARIKHPRTIRNLEGKKEGD